MRAAPEAASSHAGSGSKVRLLARDFVPKIASHEKGPNWCFRETVSGPHNARATAVPEILSYNGPGCWDMPGPPLLPVGLWGLKTGSQVGLGSRATVPLQRQYRFNFPRPRLDSSPYDLPLRDA